MDADPALLQQAERDHPHLITREAWGKKISSAALGAKNIKRMLSKAFPGVSFRVKSDIYSMGSSAYIYWDEPTEEGIYKQVDKMTELFQSSGFNGMDDSTTYDNTPYNVAFRKLFGSVSSVVPQPTRLTPERKAQMDNDALQGATTPAPARRRGPRL